MLKALLETVESGRCSNLVFHPIGVKLCQAVSTCPLQPGSSHEWLNDSVRSIYVSPAEIATRIFPQNLSLLHSHVMRNIRDLWGSMMAQKPPFLYLQVTRSKNCGLESAVKGVYFIRIVGDSEIPTRRRGNHVCTCNCKNQRCIAKGCCFSLLVVFFCRELHGITLWNGGVLIPSTTPDPMAPWPSPQKRGSGARPQEFPNQKISRSFDHGEVVL